MEDPRINDHLETVAALAADYGITDTELADLRTRLDLMPFGYRAGYVASQIEMAVAATATEHRRECVRVGCRVCEALKPGLALCVTNMRTVVDHHLEQQMQGPPRAGWLMRLAARVWFPVYGRVMARRRV